MAQAGWFPTSQTYAPGTWSSTAFIVALLLCILLVGILILIYLIVVKPDGTLVVTYEYRGVGASAPPIAAAPVNWATSAAAAGSLCGRCGKHLSPAWVGKCQHCGARYTEFPPLAGT